jgi:hypothetical protein
MSRSHKQVWKSHRTAHSLLVLLILPFVLLHASAQAQSVRINVEVADSVYGPWSSKLSDDFSVAPDGSLLVTPSPGAKFARLHIQPWDETMDTPYTPLDTVPSNTVLIASQHLAAMAITEQADDTDRLAEPPWQSAQLAPLVIKVYDPAYLEGREPAYYEFKIIAIVPPWGLPETPVGFLEGNDAEPDNDLGYILVSASSQDAPVPQFSTTGATACEELLARVRSPQGVKIMRFGPMFSTVEDGAGNLLASAGTDPFKLPLEMLQYTNQTFSGMFDSESGDVGGPDEDGWAGPKVDVQHYRDYQELREDFVENPVYQELRRRRSRAVQAEWDILRGDDPPPVTLLTVVVGSSTNLLERQVVTRWLLDDDEDEDGGPLAFIEEDASRQGLKITGVRPGLAPLTVATVGDGVVKFYLEVVESARPSVSAERATKAFTVGWQTPVTWKAGTYAEQPRYRQLNSSEWCSSVGCGPVAWAIAFAWWDRRGVPSAFYSWSTSCGDTLWNSLGTTDAPSGHDQYCGWYRVWHVYRQLHDYCDVICSSASNAGATPPGDMIEGGATYTWIPRVFGFLGWRYSWAWDLMDPDWNDPSRRVRSAIKSKRVGVIGLGYLWHYAVAYEYRYQAFKLAPNYVLVTRRWFKCNQGWGKNKGAWYSGGDTFLGVNMKLWQRSVPAASASQADLTALGNMLPSQAMKVSLQD